MPWPSSGTPHGGRAVPRHRPPVWRFLCLLGLIASIVAAIATNLHKSQDLAARITAAESCDADLEGLQTLLRFGRISTEEAVDLYKGYLARIPHVDEPV
jgi:hypothetical protein